MQIPPSPIAASVSGLLTDVASPVSERRSDATVARTSADKTDTLPLPPGSGGEVAESARVSISANVGQLQSAPEFPPVYAEIWKNGLKVAVVDVTGGVSSANGSIAPSFGGGTGGILLAARRAAEVAGALGGEINIGGQVLDVQTMNTRTKLNLAYGVSQDSAVLR